MKTIEVSGVWLRQKGGETQVLVEVNGEWRLAIRETVDELLSHIVEPLGIAMAPVERDEMVQ
jgi:hypothetical protein